MKRYISKSQCKLCILSEIDVIGLLEEMTTSLMDSNEFDYSIFHIGNGKVTMSLFNQKITLTTSDIDLLKSMFNN